MLQRAIQTGTVVALGALLVACGGEDSVVSSSYVPTGNMRATIEVYSDGEANAYASTQLLRTGTSSDSYSGDEYVELRGDDSLWFTRGESLRDVTLSDDWFESLADLEQTQQLFDEEYRYRPSILFPSSLIPERVHYNGRLTGVPEAGRYTVSLLRGSGKDALDSTVQIPASFDLLAPTAEAQLSRSSDPLIVEWHPGETDVYVELDVTTVCAREVEHQYLTTLNSDEGYAEIEPGAIDAPELSGQCTTSVTVAKVQTGELDPAYASGSITARQVRSVSFTSTQ